MQNKIIDIVIALALIMVLLSMFLGMFGLTLEFIAAGR